MSTRAVYDLPPFDTGQYEGCEFRMHAGGASLLIHVAELGTLTIFFRRVRWHQFAALPNCTHEVIQSAYFRLVEVSSPQLADFINADKSPNRAYSELHHYRIFLDETGCHELFAESFSAA